MLVRSLVCMAIALVAGVAGATDAFRLDPRTPAIEHRRPNVEPRRPNVEPRRPSVEYRRPSVEPRRPNVEFRRPTIERGIDFPEIDMPDAGDGARERRD